MGVGGVFAFLIFVLALVSITNEKQKILNSIVQDCRDFQYNVYIAAFTETNSPERVNIYLFSFAYNYTIKQHVHPNISVQPQNAW